MANKGRNMQFQITEYTICSKLVVFLTKYSPLINYKPNVIISLLPCIIILNIQRILKTEIWYDNSNRIAGVSWGTMGTKSRTGDSMLLCEE